MSTDQNGRYSFTMATDEKYLPDPRPNMVADFPTVILSTLGNIADYCAERSSVAMPDLFDVDPIRAANAYNAFRLMVAHGADAAELRAYVPVQLWPQLTLLAERLAGEVRIGNAAEPAPKVLNQTRTHPANMLGQVKTYRAHMTIVDSAGQTADTFDLMRQADALIRANSETGTLDHLGLIGTEDRAYEETFSQARFSDEDLTDPITGDPLPEGYYVNEYGEVRAMLSKPADVDGGKVIHGPHSRTDRCTYRSDAHRVLIGTRDRWADLVDGMVPPAPIAGMAPRGSHRRPDEATPFAPFTSTAPIYGEVISFRRMVMVGHGTWTAPAPRNAKRANVPTTRAARVKRSHAARTEATSDAAAPLTARTLALALHEAQTTTDTDAPRPSVKPRKILTDSGLLITIGVRSDGRYNVRLHIGKVAQRSTVVGSPDAVAAVVSNALTQH